MNVNPRLQTHPKILAEVVRRAGGVRNLASELGVATQSIYRWRQVPTLRVLDIERLTGIPRSHLRPDIYPPERE